MKKLNSSLKQIGRFAGKWVIIDPKKEKIIAASDSLKEVGHLASHTDSNKHPVGTVPYAFLVPRKDEGPYVL